MSDTPTCAGNEAVVDRLWGEVFNGGRMEVLDELVATEFVNFDQLVHGPRFLAELIEAQRRAFPDMRFATIQTLADRDWVITRSRWSGSFREPFSFIGLTGVEPTGRLFDVNHVHAFRLSAGKVVEHWAVRDDLTMHTQLGVHPHSGTRMIGRFGYDVAGDRRRGRSHRNRVVEARGLGPTKSV